MHPTQMIFRSLSDSDPDYPEIPGGVADGVCAVTGREGPTVARKHLFGKSFTNIDLLAAPESDRVSVGAYVSLKYKWERMSSWICDGEVFRRLDRIGVRDAVFGAAPEKPWCAYATVSYKKHGALKSPVNAGPMRVWLFEERRVDCSDAGTVSDWWTRLNAALRAGFGRSILETLDCPEYVMRKCGLGKWLEFERWAWPRRGSALYAFLCYLLPSQEELKCYR